MHVHISLEHYVFLACTGNYLDLSPFATLLREENVQLTAVGSTLNWLKNWQQSWCGEKKEKKNLEKRTEYLCTLMAHSSFSLKAEQGKRRDGELESREEKNLNGVMRRMEKQIILSFQSGILMSCVCVTRRRQCLTGLKEIFRGQATDKSIESKTQDSGPMWYGSGM